MSSQSHPDAIIVVDPISTGANVAFEVYSRKYACICVMSGHLAPALLHMVDPRFKIDFAATVIHDPSKPITETAMKLQQLPFHIIACVSGSEPGVEVTDMLTESLRLPTNGTALSHARRDKYLMGETVRAAGVRAVKQQKVRSWDDVKNFVQQLKPDPFKIVIKPVRSAGSDSVYLCESESELESRFKQIFGSQNQLGETNDAALVQEFLEGTEYVVDTVSRDGVHKVIAIWAYDKRSIHGVHFVYFGMRSVDGDSAIGQSLFQYQKLVLTALGIKHGAGHGEVIMTKTGPCLVEVGARCHGAEGTFMPLADRCWGQNQVSALIDSVLPDPTAFNKVPDRCGKELAVGYKIDFVCFVTGKLKSYQHLDEMKALPSFMRFDCLPNIGDELKLTVDCFTAVGSATLANEDEKQLNLDIAKIREYEKTMFVV